MMPSTYSCDSCLRVSFSSLISEGNSADSACSCCLPHFSVFPGLRTRRPSVHPGSMFICPATGLASLLREENMREEKLCSLEAFLINCLKEKETFKNA